LTGAVPGALVNAATGSVAPGILASVVAAIFLGLLFATVTLIFAADQIVTGAGINLLALGASGALYERLANPAAQIRGAWPFSLSIFAAILAAAVWLFFRRMRQ